MDQSRRIIALETVPRKVSPEKCQQPRNPKKIAKQLELHESTLGRILDKLETHNYIKREKGIKKNA